MSGDDRPIWMQPVRYNDDRFEDEPAGVSPSGYEFPHERDDDPEDDPFVSGDDEPIDYSRGPNDDEFGVDDDFDGFVGGDLHPIDYGSGPHDDEFGVDEDDG